jgi:hypothetical protein
VSGLDQSIRIEMFGDLLEYGALGRLGSAMPAAAMRRCRPNGHRYPDWTQDCPPPEYWWT